MRIRHYQPSDVNGVLLLFEERGLPFDEKLFDWKKAAPHICSWVGEDCGRIVAHYAVIEMPLFESVRMGFGIDGIFAKSHSRVEDIHDMLQYAASQMRLAGLAGILAFANPRMKTIKQFLGWQPIGQYEWVGTDGNLPELRAIALPRAFGAAAAYETWRWKAPRAYRGLVTNDECAALFSLTGEERPTLLWHDSRHWSAIERCGGFRYLGRSASPMGSLSSSQGIEPLYYSLADSAADIAWPEIWPLETVEGVTLGW